MIGMNIMSILVADNISSEVLNGFATGSVGVQTITLMAIVIGAIFVNNVVLSQFLGICPFLGVSSRSRHRSVWVWPLRSLWDSRLWLRG